MKERRRIFWLLVSLCILSGTTMGSSFPEMRPTPVPVTKEDGVPAGGFRLSVMINRRQFVSGEQILLKASLINTTQETLRILGTIFQLDYEIEVRNEKGELAPLTEEGKRSPQRRGIDISLGYIYIDAGKERTELLEVNRLYDMAAAGEYRIVVRRGIPGRALNQPVVVSNTLVLRVTGKD